MKKQISAFGSIFNLLLNLMLVIFLIVFLLNLLFIRTSLQGDWGLMRGSLLGFEGKIKNNFVSAMQIFNLVSLPLSSAACVVLLWSLSPAMWIYCECLSHLPSVTFLRIGPHGNAFCWRISPLCTKSSMAFEWVSELRASFCPNIYNKTLGVSQRASLSRCFLTDMSSSARLVKTSLYACAKPFWCYLDQHRALDWSGWRNFYFCTWFAFSLSLRCFLPLFLRVHAKCW